MSELKDLQRRLADLEQKFDRLADIVAEKLQEPKEDITITRKQ